MPKLLYADEISGDSPKSLKVYHGSKRTKVEARLKGISRQDSDSEEMSGE